MVVSNLSDNTIPGSDCGFIPASMPAAKKEDQVQKNLRIMLLGKSGVGKSSSGNTILGQYVFKSDMRLVKVTTHCENVSGTVEDVPIDLTNKVKDVTVDVIDTPGFFETDRNEEDSVRAVLQCVRFLEPGPHAFVLVVPIGRMTQEDRNTNQLIESMFGPRVWDYTIVLFTHGDRLDEKTINETISESDINLRNFIRKCGGGFHVFNNKNEQDPAQVTSFIAKIDTLVALNGGLCYDKKMYPKEERKIRERQESILAERDAEIRRKEGVLLQHHQGAELEEKKKKLWREEESMARLAAEKEIERNSQTLYILRVILLMVAVVVLCWAVPSLWILAVIIILLWISFEGFPFISTKIPWLSKMKHE